MKVLVTGSNGFIGKNLATQLAVRGDFEILHYNRESTPDGLRLAVEKADFICHMAGVNRPENVDEFARINTGLTETLCHTVQKSGRHVPIIFASSVHVEQDNPYGASKLAAEQALLTHSEKTGIPVYIFRLPHVFGKWGKPDYNSVVATFCYNIAHDLPIQIDDSSYSLNLVYIDDLVATFVRIMVGNEAASCEVEPSYTISVGELADQIRAFRASRGTLVSERVGDGLIRALYSTYVSYLSPKDFAYEVPNHADSRGVFVEMLKTRDSGQFSFFTAYPGVTRGGHYHHSKTEKFLVVKGNARFRFRHTLTQEFHEVLTSGDKPEIVETIPGWSHDITNVGDDEMIVMLWANEIFDRDRPDTYADPV
ncbi:MAG: SDR family oxidoreductase [Nitrospinae bacterium]|nr:SDR family oxidoreductase [Nitrospinota bacterium]MBL7021332.1 NAD-dependent epimerase/dehydratase family protein [Nitrospinaceae bacterium]